MDGDDLLSTKAMETCGRLLLAGLVIGLVTAGCAPRPRVLSGFGDFYFMGRPRPSEISPHTGVDFAAGHGEPVLAPADGTIVFAGQGHPWCGIAVHLEHKLALDDPFEGVYYSHYCHLSETTVKEGPVKRGNVIGRVGNTGVYAGNVTHLHFELLKGITRMRVDPMPHIVGCFDSQKSYPTDRLALTYPLKC